MGSFTLCTENQLMRDVLIFLSMTGACVYWLTPRVFHFADRHVAVSRLSELKQVDHPSAVASIQQTDALPLNTDWAALCDSVARCTRSGRSARDALKESLHSMDDAWQPFIQKLEEAPSVSDWFTSLLLNAKNHEKSAITLLSHTIVHGNFVPQSLDQASRTLRDIRQSSRDIASATSQSQLSARLLTAFPLCVLTFGVLTSSSVRHGLTTPAVVFFLVLGGCINKAGWIWTKRLVRSVRKESHLDVFAIADHMCVSMYAGMSATQSLMAIPHSSALATSISSALSEGFSLSQGLEPLLTHPFEFSRNFATLVLTAEMDGLPLLQSVQQLSMEARLERRSQTEALIRQLPTRLTLPLVLCFLPSFLLCSVAPFISVVLTKVMLPHATFS